MMQPEEGNILQHRHYAEAYQSWSNKYCCGYFTIMTNMNNDIMGKCPTVQDMWTRFKIVSGDISRTGLVTRTLNFDAYLMDPKHTT